MAAECPLKGGRVAECLLKGGRVGVGVVVVIGVAVGISMQAQLGRGGWRGGRCAVSRGAQEKKPATAWLRGAPAKQRRCTNEMESARGETSTRGKGAWHAEGLAVSASATAGQVFALSGLERASHRHCPFGERKRDPADDSCDAQPPAVPSGAAALDAKTPADSARGRAASPPDDRHLALR